jgi:hypothetical protein
MVSPACESDSGPEPWNDFEPTDAGVDARDAQMDGGDAGRDTAPDTRDATDTTDTFDAVDTTDGGPDGTFQRPDIAVFPDQPTQFARCNDEQWCWIHPSPFPYRIDELKRDGDRLLGVAHSNGLQEVQLFIWDGASMNLVGLGGVDDSSITAVTPADGGWLSVTGDGVYWHNPDGSSQLAFNDTRAGGYDEITGHSPDEFVLSSSTQEDGLVVHEGESTYYPDLPGIGPPHMWPNSEVWTVEADPDQPESTPFFLEWDLLPRTSDSEDYSPSVLGPSPTSACGNRIVGYVPSRGFVEWPDRDTPPVDIPAENTMAHDIVCGWNDEVTAVGNDGRYMQGDPDGAQWYEGGFYDLYGAGTLDGTTYAGGELGALYGISDDGIEAFHCGFRPPAEPLQPTQRTHFTSLWVNVTETQAALTYRSGASFGDADGWQQTPAPLREDGRKIFGLEHTDIWGVDQPEFAIASDRLYRWDDTGDDGPRWVDAGIKNPGGPYEELVDIDGTSRNNIWVATTASLFRYDGDTWSEAGNSNLIESTSNGIGALQFDNDGDLLVIDSDYVYELDVSTGDWALSTRFDSPCENPTTLGRDANGHLLVAGRSLCVARRAGGAWEKLQVPDSVTSALGPAITLEQGWEFVRQPGSRPMLLATSVGLFELQDDGTLTSEFVGNTIEAEYLPMYNAVWVLTQSGVVAKYY